MSWTGWRKSTSYALGACSGPEQQSYQPPLARAFLFTEYVEGSSTYKALELSALDDSSLDGCRIAVYFNGGTEASGSALEGTLLAGERTVICSSSLAELIDGCDHTAGL